jgi:hypothetical protein
LLINICFDFFISNFIVCCEILNNNNNNRYANYLQSKRPVRSPPPSPPSSTTITDVLAVSSSTSSQPIQKSTSTAIDTTMMIVEDKENIPSMDLEFLLKIQPKKISSRSRRQSSYKHHRHHQQGFNLLDDQDQLESEQDSDHHHHIQNHHRRQTLSPSSAARQLLIDQVEIALQPNTSTDSTTSDVLTISVIPEIESPSFPPLMSSGTLSNSNSALSLEDQHLLDAELSTVLNMVVTPVTNNRRKKRTNDCFDNHHHRISKESKEEDEENEDNMLYGNVASRRGTLSPSAARLIVLEIMEEEINDFHRNDNNSSSHSPASDVQQQVQEGIEEAQQMIRDSESPSKDSPIGSLSPVSLTMNCDEIEVDMIVNSSIENTNVPPMIRSNSLCAESSEDSSENEVVDTEVEASLDSEALMIQELDLVLCDVAEESVESLPVSLEAEEITEVETSHGTEEDIFSVPSETETAAVVQEAILDSVVMEMEEKSVEPIEETNSIASEITPVFIEDINEIAILDSFDYPTEDIETANNISSFDIEEDDLDILQATSTKMVIMPSLQDETNLLNDALDLQLETNELLSKTKVSSSRKSE